MRRSLPFAFLLTTCLLAACSQPTSPAAPTGEVAGDTSSPGVPSPAKRALGLYTLSMSTDQQQAPTIAPLGVAVKTQALTEVATLTFQPVATTTFITTASQVRHVTAFFRVTNTGSQPLSGVVMMPVNLDPVAGSGAAGTTIGPTMFSKVSYYDGSDASARAGDVQPEAAQRLGSAASAEVDPNGTPFADAALGTLTPAPPAGTSANFVGTKGWTVGALAPGASTLVAFAVNFPTSAQGTAHDPFSFNLVFSPVAQDSVVASGWEVAQTHVIPAQGLPLSSPSGVSGTLHLVGNRSSVVLVSAPNTSQPVLQASVGGQVLGTVPLNAPATLPKSEAGGPAYSTTKFWATLPAGWVQPGLSVRVIDGGVSSPAQAINVGMPTTLNLKILPFYLYGATEATKALAAVNTVPAAAADAFRESYPISTLTAGNVPGLPKVQWNDLVVSPRNGNAAYVATASDMTLNGFDTLSAMHDVVSKFREANGESALNTQYYAPLVQVNSQGASVGAGGGIGGSEVGTGDTSYSGVFVHEQGHAFGLGHAGDEYALNTYPYPGGSLSGSAWGYDSVKALFLPTFVPATASSFKTCAASHQLNSGGTCIKQDPMQSGAGDQDPAFRFALFSDYNSMRVQQHFEGVTTDSPSGHTYSGGYIEVDPQGGYRRWDTLSNDWVKFVPSTASKGLYGINQLFPVQVGVPVTGIFFTLSRATPAVNRIQPPMTYTGNLIQTFDPTDPAQLSQIRRNTGVYANYCQGTGCDYTLRVTYNDTSVRSIVVKDSFRTWWSPTTWNPDSVVATKSASFHSWMINVPTGSGVKTAEILDTPGVDTDGLPANPVVLASSGQ